MDIDGSGYQSATPADANQEKKRKTCYAVASNLREDTLCIANNEARVTKIVY
jgi:hypothetical protein